MSSDTGLVVVGVDGGASDWEAVDWAAAEACARRTSLHIVHTYCPRAVFDPYGFAAVMLPTTDLETAGEQLLAMAERRARSVDRTLSVTTQLGRGRLTDVLGRLEREVSLVVIGRTSRWSSLIGCPGERVARQSTPPVVVASLSRKRMNGPCSGRVVIPVDNDDPTAVALFALCAAQRRGVGITVLAAGRSRSRHGRSRWSRPSDEQLALAGTLRDLSQFFGEVDIRWRYLPRRSAAEVLEELAGAALVVIASRRSRRMAKRLGTSSVRRALARSSSTPVAIIGNTHLDATIAW